MIILDHNIPQGQAEQLHRWRIHFRQVGFHVGRPEWDDQQEILRYLHTVRQGTFFTRDLGFYRSRLRHPRYCIVVIDDAVLATASAIRRFLRHRNFRTKAIRSGLVVKISPTKIWLWRTGKERQDALNW